MLKCIKRGVVYHHGRVPEIIRLYVEKMFSKHKGFEFIATTSTLLEGVNIPAEKIFLLSIKKGRRHLTKSNFNNLTGRVCRFSEIFSSSGGHLGMLEPEIYLLNCKYSPKDFKPEVFLEKKAKVTANDKDEIKNILLKEPETKEEEIKELEALEYVENIEKGCINTEKNVKIRYVESDIAKYCFKNNIHEFNIHDYEKELVKRFEFIKEKGTINDVNTLLAAITKIFIEIIDLQTDKQKRSYYELLRLKNISAQNFYSFFLDWRMSGSSYSKMVSAILYYWRTKQEEEFNYKVYVGTAWGETKRDEADFVERYIDLSIKNKAQKINMAILKIKDEQDFVEFNILKFIEVLNDLGLLDENFYEKIKYGSADKNIICMLKNGISMELAKILNKAKYSKFLNLNLEKDNIIIDENIILVMEGNKENKILIFELSFHV